MMKCVELLHFYVFQCVPCDYFVFHSKHIIKCLGRRSLLQTASKLHDQHHHPRLRFFVRIKTSNNGVVRWASNSDPSLGHRIVAKPRLRIRFDCFRSKDFCGADELGFSPFPYKAASIAFILGQRKGCQTSYSHAPFQNLAPVLTPFIPFPQFIPVLASNTQIERPY